MMGRNQILKSAMEYDVVYARKIYCYLVNRSQNVKFAKRKMNKRYRQQNKIDKHELISIDGVWDYIENVA